MPHQYTLGTMMANWGRVWAMRQNHYRWMLLHSIICNWIKWFPFCLPFMDNWTLWFPPSPIKQCGKTNPMKPQCNDGATRIRANMYAYPLIKSWTLFPKSKQQRKNGLKDRFCNHVTWFYRQNIFCCGHFLRSCGLSSFASFRFAPLIETI